MIMPNTDADKFIESFQKVKEMGEIKSNRSGNTGVGKTLEDIMNVEENNLQIPDLFNFEIKSQRNLSESYVTLFTKSPKPPRINNTLRLKYGSNDEVFNDIKVLHTSVFHSRWNTHMAGYGYRTYVDYENEKLLLKLKSLETDVEEDFTIYWDFEDLNIKLNNKLQNLAFVKADVSRREDGEYFFFKECILYTGGLTLNRFLKAIEDDYIMFDVRIGAYKNPNNRATYGKIHDHGSGFRIKKQNFLNLYDRELRIT